MGGPGSGRRPEGGGDGGSAKVPRTEGYSHLKVKMAERNRKYTSSGMPKGGVNIAKAKALQKAAFRKK